MDRKGPNSRLSFPGYAAMGLFSGLLAISHQVSARVGDAILNFAGIDSGGLPAKLSQTGLYQAGTIANPGRQVSEGIVAFTVNSPLWSDGAFKSRWVQVPAGQKITPTDTDHYSFPDKTLFIKNFAIDSIYGDPASRILIETRFLVVRIIDADSNGPSPRDTGTYGISYWWNRGQTDANLVVNTDGLDGYHKVMLGGKAVGKRWRYPSFGECANCHSGRGVLGFITPQLNNGTQLQGLFDAGVLSKLPPAGATPPVRWYATDDAAPAATPEKKVRSYFAANCSHCHGNNQHQEGAHHDFDYWDPSKKVDTTNKAGYVGHITGKDLNYPQLIYPAYPESSYIMYRITQKASPGNFKISPMPPLATYQLDSTSMKVVKDWICSLGSRSTPCQFPPMEADTAFWDSITVGTVPHGFHAKRTVLKAFMNGNTLVVQGNRGLGRPGLFDFTGREIPLRRLSEGRYAIAAELRPGIYFFRQAGQSARVNYLR